MRNLYIFYITIALLVFHPVSSFADTYIVEKRLTKDTLLTKSKSPYLIDHTITVASGVRITAERGVKIIFDGGGLFLNGGMLSGDGITFESRSGSDSTFLISGNQATIQLSDIDMIGSPQSIISAWNNSKVLIEGFSSQFSGNTENITAFQIFNGTSLMVSDSVFSRFDKSIDVFNESVATITNSVFEHNKKAVYTFNSRVFLRKNDFIYNTIALEYFSNNPSQSIVNAEDNWWGHADGPKIYSDNSYIKQTDSNVLLGDIMYAPWSKVPNRQSNDKVSNVLFLPGLMGSRLYQKGIFENQLWEPNRNKDVAKLFLNSLGISMQDNIYTRDVLAKTNLVGGIDAIEKTPYKDFFTYMDGLVKNNIITAWKPAPYDWRYSPDVLIEEGIRTGDEYGNIIVRDLVTEVLLLAKTSKTKKVTIVTHSNGGLVAKRLMIELARKNIDTLVDKIIFVAMPEYGTPQAITSLMYGHEQAIAGGLILSAHTAKKLGINMPTAYMLLPSQKYFDVGKNIVFNTTTLNTKQNLNVALTEKVNINNHLMHKADQLHAVLDTWIAPSYIPIYQIVGTGILTVSGYMEKIDKTPLPIYTSTGDGVVQDMYDDASQIFSRSGMTVAVNLHNTKYTHMDLMNYTGTMKYVDSLIRKTPTVYEPYIRHSDTYTLIHLTPAFATSSLSDKRIHTKTSDGETALSYIDGSQYSTVLHENPMSRYMLLGSNIQHISQLPVEHMYIEEQKGGVFDLEIFNKTETNTVQMSYDNIKLFGGSGLMSKMGELNAEIILPAVNQRIDIPPTKEIIYDQNTGHVSEKSFSTSTEDFSVKIARIQNSIQTSNITSHVKILYISRLKTILKNQDPKALTALREKAGRAVTSIRTLSTNPALRGRYSKLKQDYMYLAYILE